MAGAVNLFTAEHKVAAPTPSGGLQRRNRAWVDLFARGSRTGLPHRCCRDRTCGLPALGLSGICQLGAISSPRTSPQQAVSWKIRVPRPTFAEMQSSRTAPSPGRVRQCRCVFRLMVPAATCRAQRTQRS